MRAKVLIRRARHISAQACSKRGNKRFPGPGCAIETFASFLNNNLHRRIHPGVFGV
jgi:hypothetical protein